ncbi:hypothetical protein V6N12_031850 [Hibiscus sabdariffa]|uniref:Uncharacterized protein n=1 Tax=Hibiscus sabdariffa TaxID=183260 RepID=A0ABR2C036_9ROSI
MAITNRENPVKILTAGAPPSALVLLRIESLEFVVNHSDEESEAESKTGGENSGYDGSGRDGSRVRSEFETRWVNAREIILRGACVMSGNEYCRANLTHYMVPKMVVFKVELPKTSTGKIQMFVRREIARGMSSCPSTRVAHFFVGDCHGRGKEKGRNLRSEGMVKL